MRTANGSAYLFASAIANRLPIVGTAASTLIGLYGYFNDAKFSSIQDEYARSGSTKGITLIESTMYSSIGTSSTVYNANINKNNMIKQLLILAAFFMLLPIYSQQVISQTKHEVAVQASSNMKYLGTFGNELSPEIFHDSLSTGEFALCLNDSTMSLERIRPDISLVVGSELPSNSYCDMNNKFHKIGEEKGLSVLILWSPSCGPCIRELIVFNEFASEYPKVDFYAITGAKATDIKSFFEKRQLSWDNLIIIPEYKGDYDTILKTRLEPTNLIVDKNRIIKYASVGDNYKRALFRNLETLLKKE